MDKQLHSIQAAVKKNRLARFKKYFASAALLNFKATPTAISECGKKIAELHQTSNFSTVVSFHYKEYFSFFLLAKNIPLTIYVFADAPVAAGYKKLSAILPSNIVFCAQLTRDIVRNLKNKSAIVFVMADIRISPLDTHYVNIFGKIGLYTTAWADLCLKLNSDALFLLSQGSGSHSIDMIPHNGFTALEMVENLFGKFEQRVSTETFDWENYPLHCGLNDSLGLTHENTPNGIAKALGGLLAWSHPLCNIVREIHENT